MLQKSQKMHENRSWRGSCAPWPKSAFSLPQHTETHRSTPCEGQSEGQSRRALGAGCAAARQVRQLLQRGGELLRNRMRVAVHRQGYGGMPGKCCLWARRSKTEWTASSRSWRTVAIPQFVIFKDRCRFLPEVGNRPWFAYNLTERLVLHDGVRARAQRRTSQVASAGKRELGLVVLECPAPSVADQDSGVPCNDGQTK